MTTRKAARKAAIDATRPTRKRRPVNPEFTKKDRTLAQDLLHLRKRKRLEQEAKAKYDALKQARDIFEGYVIDRMEFEGAESQRADGTLFVPTQTLRAQVQDRGEFVAWALEHEPELLREHDVRQGDLNTLVRRLIDDEEELPPGVGYYIQTYVSQKAS